MVRPLRQYDRSGSTTAPAVRSHRRYDRSDRIACEDSNVRIDESKDLLGNARGQAPPANALLRRLQDYRPSIRPKGAPAAEPRYRLSSRVIDGAVWPGPRAERLVRRVPILQLHVPSAFIE